MFEVFVRELVHGRSGPYVEVTSHPNYADANSYILKRPLDRAYADPDDVINTFQPPRIEVDEYAVFLDWD